MFAEDSAVAESYFSMYTRLKCLRGTTGSLTQMDSELPQAATDLERERTLELLREVARRANWDAQHGPRHLRTGRFFVSPAQEAHASERASQKSPTRET